MLDDLKELDKFFKICRKQGVTEITFDSISVKFGDLPSKNVVSEEDSDLLSESLTPEQLMFYAVQDV